MKIKRDSNGDTRTAKCIPTIRQFDIANESHRENVGELMKNFGREITIRGTIHDWTKEDEPHRSEFYQDLIRTMKGDMVFERGEWAKLHYERERHHLDKVCPDDVDLIDVIEMICDCVCAGLARSGEVRSVEITSTILMKAVANTVERLARQIEIVE